MMTSRTEPPATGAVGGQTMVNYAEELVYTETRDRLLLEGIVVRPVGVPLMSVAVVCIHGFPGNFYTPLLVRIGRGFAGRGMTFVSGNTRGHDIGARVLRKDEQPLHAGSWWELFDESPHDVAAWTDFAAGLGSKGVVLIGYSIGATKVIVYQAERRDPRVRGVASISGPMRRHLGITPEFVGIAESMMAEGNGHALMPVAPWNRRYSPPKPGPVSAQTYLSWTRRSLDVFGLDAREPAIAAVGCPLFACYGTGEPDIGMPDDLEMIRRNAKAAAAIRTAVFEGADHSYAGHEERLIETLAAWVTSIA